MFLITVSYPTFAEERRIAEETTSSGTTELTEVIDGPTLQKYQELVERVPVPDHVYDDVVEMGGLPARRVTRHPSGSRNGSPGQWPACHSVPHPWRQGTCGLAGTLRGGLGRRGSGGQAVLSHRILTNFQAQSEGWTACS